MFIFAAGAVMACMWFTRSWLLVCYVAALEGSVRTGTADDTHAGSLQTRRVTWKEDWSPEAVSDLVVMGYDRGGGSVVGYQQSTGRVFAQKTHSSATEPVPLILDSGIIVQMGVHGEPCSVVTVTGQESPRTTVALRSSEHRGQTWRLKTFTGFTEVMDTMRFDSNRYDDLACECSVKPRDGLFRKTMLLSGMGQCEVIASTEFTSLHAHEKPPAKSERLVGFCDSLADTLASLQGGFFTVSDQWWRRNGGGACKQVSLAALAHLKQLRADASTAQLVSVPQAPRASVLMDLKHAAQTVDTAESTLSVLTTITEQILLFARSRLNATDLDRIHAHRKQSNQRMLARQVALAVDEPDDLIALSFNRSCDARYNSYAAEFLASKSAAMTPDYVNTTRLAYAVSTYVAEYAACHSVQLEAVHSLLRCAASVWGGSERTHSDDGADSLMGVSTASAGPSDVSSALASLDSLLSNRNAKDILDTGQTPEALSDEVVRLAAEAGDAVLRRVSSVGGTFTAFMRLWSDYGDTNFTSTDTKDALEDVWCCGVLARGGYVQDDRYPPCLPHIERLVQRALSQR